jgi:hypothetical protein
VGDEDRDAAAVGYAGAARRAAHPAAARPGSAFGRTAKNFHSLRSVSSWSTVAFCHRTGARTGPAAHRTFDPPEPSLSRSGHQEGRPPWKRCSALWTARRSEVRFSSSAP